MPSTKGVWTKVTTLEEVEVGPARMEDKQLMEVALKPWTFLLNETWWFSRGSTIQHLEVEEAPLILVYSNIKIRPHSQSVRMEASSRIISRSFYSNRFSNNRYLQDSQGLGLRPVVDQSEVVQIVQVKTGSSNRNSSILSSLHQQPNTSWW